MSPGSVLDGRYRLDVLLSEHGGARFWRATDTVLERSVAVHVVASSDPRAPAVLDAARRSAGVSEPHFLRVLDCDDVNGLTWVINEWGDGTSLDVMLAHGSLPPMRAAWLTREVAEAIAVAHGKGLVHGRLNPESVLVTESGSVKIIGFVVNAAFERSRPGGSPYGPISDRDADVVDLAGILYASLTGRWPGIAPSAVPPAPREGSRPLRPRQVRAGVPRTLDTICDRVLHKEAAQHVMPIETAHEIAAALSDFVGDPAAVAPVDVPSMHDDPEAPGSMPGAVPAAVSTAVPTTPPAAAPPPAQPAAASGTPSAVSAPSASSSPAASPSSAFDVVEDIQPEPYEPTPAPTPPAASVAPTPPAAASSAAPAALAASAPAAPAARAAAAAQPDQAAKQPDRQPDRQPTGQPAGQAGAGPAAELDATMASAAPFSPSGIEFLEPEQWEPAAPPPPFSQPASRPLFAEGTRRVPPGAPAMSGSRDEGTGSPLWPFTEEPPTTEPGGRRPRRRRVRALVIVLLLAVLLAATYVAYRSATASEDPEPARPSARPTTSSAPVEPVVTGSPISIAASGDFDPEGDPPAENPGQVPQATDGKPGTGWRTSVYSQADLGGLKSGVGIVLDLGKDQEVGSVEVRLVGAPTSLELWASAPGTTNAPVELSDTVRVGGVTADSTAATFRLASKARTRYLVVWLTKLPPVPRGFQGQIAEITVRS